MDTISYTIINVSNSNSVAALRAALAQKAHIQFKPVNGGEWYDFPCSEINEVHLRDNFFRIDTGLHMFLGGEMEVPVAASFPAAPYQHTWHNPQGLTAATVSIPGGFRLLTNREVRVLDELIELRRFVQYRDIFGVWRAYQSNLVGFSKNDKTLRTNVAFSSERYWLQVVNLTGRSCVWLRKNTAVSNTVSLVTVISDDRIGHGNTGNNVYIADLKSGDASGWEFSPALHGPWAPLVNKVKI